MTDPWPCRWCGYHAPTKSMRDQHIRECPVRPASAHPEHRHLEENE